MTFTFVVSLNLRFLIRLPIFILNLSAWFQPMDFYFEYVHTASFRSVRPKEPQTISHDDKITVPLCEAKCQCLRRY